MKVTELNKAVKLEAKNLKENATKKELKKLDFDELKPNHHESCIYGQMTGSCFSKRAVELINGCAPSLLDGKISDEFDTTELKLRKFVKDMRSRNDDDETFWSPIEVFIVEERNKENGNNERLINYLKGLTDKLILE